MISVISGLIFHHKTDIFSTVYRIMQVEIPCKDFWRVYILVSDNCPDLKDSFSSFRQ